MNAQYNMMTTASHPMLQHCGNTRPPFKVRTLADNHASPAVSMAYHRAQAVLTQSVATMTAVDAVQVVAVSTGRWRSTEYLRGDTVFAIVFWALRDIMKRWH